MRPITNRFTTIHMDSHEEEIAKAVSPYFYAFLQNKIASYAEAILEVSYEGLTGDKLQEVVLNHEKLKAQVIVLEELMTELTPPTEVATETPTSDS